MLKRFTLLLALASSSLANSQYVVKTLAGDTAGYRDGVASVALFNAPTAIAADTAGNLYITDTYNNVIRKIWVKTGIVGTLAGNDSAGYRDGSATSAEFNTPVGICVDKAGNVYVADTYNNVIRKIDISGNVTTFGGNGKPGFRNGKADSAEFNMPTGVAVDTMGNLYVADDGNYMIRKIGTDDTVRTVAGIGYAGFKNGKGDTAKFNGLSGIVVNDSGVIYVTEYLNNDVRVIRNGFVSNVAGFGFGADTGLYIGPTPPGMRDGGVDSAMFNSPMGIALDTGGYIFVCDEFNQRIRWIANGRVTSFAGNGTPGWKDTVVYDAEFNMPYGLALSKDTFYVTDNFNNKIRKMVPPSAVLGVPTVSEKSASMLVYPNPCSDKFIVASAPSGSAQMMDVTGREVWNNNHVKAPFLVSTAGFAAGVYFLRVSSSEGIATQKIIIER